MWELRQLFFFFNYFSFLRLMCLPCGRCIMSWETVAWRTSSGAPFSHLKNRCMFWLPVLTIKSIAYNTKHINDLLHWHSSNSCSVMARKKPRLLHGNYSINYRFNACIGLMTRLVPNCHAFSENYLDIRQFWRSERKDVTKGTFTIVTL
jgi:hypothetical protein